MAQGDNGAPGKTVSLNEVSCNISKDWYYGIGIELISMWLFDYKYIIVYYWCWYLIGRRTGWHSSHLSDHCPLSFGPGCIIDEGCVWCDHSRCVQYFIHKFPAITSDNAHSVNADPKIIKNEFDRKKIR